MTCSHITSALVVTLLTFCGSSCAKRSRATVSIGRSFQSQSIVSKSSPIQRININTASASDLEALPAIGKALAERIVEHREKYGPFRRTEDLIMVRGISDQRFRALRDLITVQ